MVLYLVINSSNFELVRLRLDQCVSATGLCSGGPRYARSVAILSKGRLPTALWSLDVRNCLEKWSSSHLAVYISLECHSLPFFPLSVGGFYLFVNSTKKMSEVMLYTETSYNRYRTTPQYKIYISNSYFPSIFNLLPLSGILVNKSNLLIHFFSG